MKHQWMYISALVFALVIAVFSVVNVDPVPVDYVFGEAMFPMITVILGSALLGAIVSGLFALIRSFRQGRQIKALKRELAAANAQLEAAQALPSEAEGFDAVPMTAPDTAPEAGAETDAPVGATTSPGGAGDDTK